MNLSTATCQWTLWPYYLSHTRSLSSHMLLKLQLKASVPQIVLNPSHAMCVPLKRLIQVRSRFSSFTHWFPMENFSNGSVPTWLESRLSKIDKEILVQDLSGMSTSVFVVMQLSDVKGLSVWCIHMENGLSGLLRQIFVCLFVSFWRYYQSHITFMVFSWLLSVFLMDLIFQ